jgi:tripartite-type tricarboxylate transporter receptor subunit TctC
MWPPGGIADISARTIAETAEKSLGQKIVVINKPGGGGTVGSSLLAKEKPDGYTLGISADTPITRAPQMIDLEYDPFQDFTFVVRAMIMNSDIAVRADSPFRKWEDVVDWAKKYPGQLVYGHIGKGTSLHLVMVRAAKRGGFTYNDVPFTGDTPTISALLGGHVMVVGATPVGLGSHVEAKTVRILLTHFKSDFAPDASTFEEMGYEIPHADFVIYGPKGIPDPVRIILEKAFIGGIQGEKFEAVTKRYDLKRPEPLTGKALRDYLNKNYLIFKELLKEVGLHKIEKN